MNDGTHRKKKNQYRYTASRLLRAAMFMYVIRDDTLHTVLWAQLYNILPDGSRKADNPMGLFNGCTLCVVAERLYFHESYYSLFDHTTGTIPQETTVRNVVDYLKKKLGRGKGVKIMEHLNIQHITMWLCFLGNFKRKRKKSEVSRKRKKSDGKGSTKKRIKLSKKKN